MLLPAKEDSATDIVTRIELNGSVAEESGVKSAHDEGIRTHTGLFGR
jgi:hypothetical protein